jgi:hypothetical protein
VKGCISFKDITKCKSYTKISTRAQKTLGKAENIFNMWRRGRRKKIPSLFLLENYLQQKTKALNQTKR